MIDCRTSKVILPSWVQLCQRVKRPEPTVVDSSGLRSLPPVVLAEPEVRLDQLQDFFLVQSVFGQVVEVLQVAGLAQKLVLEVLPHLKPTATLSLN